MRLIRAFAALAIFSWAAFAFAQPRVLYLDPAGHPSSKGFEPFVAQLERQGVVSRPRRVEVAVESLDVAIEALRRVDLDAEVIVTAHTELARAATRLRPETNVVLATLADPRDLGFVAADGRRVANVTGFTYFVPYEHKHVELLREAAPAARSIGILADAHWAREPLSQSLLREGPRRFGVALTLFQFRQPEEIASILASPAAREMDSWFVPDGPGSRLEGERIAARIAALRRPSIGGHDSHVRGGGLLTYQPAPVDRWARMAALVKTVLGGTPAREVAFDRPVAFELLVNLRAAREIGIELPATTLKKAHRVFDRGANKP